MLGVILDTLCAAIKEGHRSGMLFSEVVLLHDNTQPHTPTRTLNKLTKFGWTVFEHQPQSPDLSPCDFHIFRKLKKVLEGRRFCSVSEVVGTIRNWFQTQRNSFCEKVFTTR
ncbi:hypothetical protein AVEN_128810-1 [Araneus ventricosus]|uniref:Histone-lysine N-methyltransferase SETMAR n=1 Tax=Araneus ventricosus TaxID=182803 RepID=A0A4Y2K5Y3_ARAVE|nr:hypothetical protein AVEN_128810-1 [Araneus ventricosus]